MGVTLSDRVAPDTSVLCRQLGEEMVLLNFESGIYYGLDAVATRAWNLLVEDKTLGDVCSIMRDEYDVAPDLLERDVMALVRDLLAKRLLVPHEARS